MLGLNELADGQKTPPMTNRREKGQGRRGCGGGAEVVGSPFSTGSAIS